MNKLTIAKELEVLDKSKADQIRAVFAPMVTMLKEFEGQYEDVVNLEQSPEKCAKAKRLRLDISKVRIEADKVRTKQKEEYLRAGNAIQGVYNILKFAVTDKEEKLKEIEQYYERIEEEKRKQKEEERIAELEKYDIDGSSLNLGTMQDSVWSNYLNGVRLNWQAVKDAETKAEQERMAKEEEEQKERERIKIENERLRKEAEEREKEIEKERQKVEEERRIQEEVLRKEREAREKIEREAREKEAEERRKEQERLIKEREEKAKAEAEEKRKASAPDREKLISAASSLLAITLSTEKAKQAIEYAAGILNKAAIEME